MTHVSRHLVTTMSTFMMYYTLVRSLHAYMWLVKAETLTCSWVALIICIEAINNHYIDECVECEDIKRLTWINDVRIH